MRERSTSHAHPAETSTRPRLRRGLFGYRRRDVEDAMTQLRLRAHELEEEAVTLREELLDARHEASETRHDLTRARAELRYWNDRASYVDSEVARARHRAADLEEAARRRAEAIEADAQERSLQLIDRVCSEANAMLQHAREEAREMFLRFETEVDMSQQKLEKLEEVRTEVARSMQGALEQFEDAVRELDKVGPVKRIVESLEQPVRRTTPTFGKQKAVDAARRFEDAGAHGASEALSSPLTARVVEVDTPADETPEDSNQAAGEAASQPSSEGTAGKDSSSTANTDDSKAEGTGKRRHDADKEFASLLGSS